MATLSGWQPFGAAMFGKAAQRHDWLHRIQVVYDTLGLAPTEKMRARVKRLDLIASQAKVPDDVRA